MEHPNDQYLDLTNITDKVVLGNLACSSRDNTLPHPQCTQTPHYAKHTGNHRIYHKTASQHLVILLRIVGNRLAIQLSRDRIWRGEGRIDNRPWFVACVRHCISLAPPPPPASLFGFCISSFAHASFWDGLPCPPMLVILYG